jgi:hypothetical protein
MFMGAMYQNTLPIIPSPQGRGIRNNTLTCHGRGKKQYIFMGAADRDIAQVIKRA